MSLLQILFAFVALVFSLGALLLCLDVVWRTKNHLTVVFKFNAVAFIFLGLRQGLSVLFFGKPENWANTILVLDILISLFFLIGAWKMYQIIRNLDNENTQN